MAWLWNKDKKRKQEILWIEKIGEGQFDIVFKEHCKYCGSGVRKLVLLKSEKDSYVKKAIDNYNSELFNKHLNNAFKIIDELDKKNKLHEASKMRYKIYDKKQMKYKFVSANEVLDLYIKHNCK